MAESLRLAQGLAQVILDTHGEDVVALDVRGLSSLTDFFILCTAHSARQLEAIREHVERAITSAGHRVKHVEGGASSNPSSGGADDARQWLLMDCGDVVVHLMDLRARSFYRLEELWADAPNIRFQDDGAGPERLPRPDTSSGVGSPWLSGAQRRATKPGGGVTLPPRPAD